MQKYISTRSVQYICADSNKSCLLWCCFCFNQSMSKKHLNTFLLARQNRSNKSLENSLKSLCLWQCFLIFLSKIIVTVTRISSCPNSHYNQLFCLYYLFNLVFLSSCFLSFSHAHSVSYMVKIPDAHNESGKPRWNLPMIVSVHNILTTVVCVFACKEVCLCAVSYYPFVNISGYWSFALARDSILSLHNQLSVFPCQLLCFISLLCPCAHTYSGKCVYNRGFGVLRCYFLM